MSGGTAQGISPLFRPEEIFQQEQVAAAVTALTFDDIDIVRLLPVREDMSRRLSLRPSPIWLLPAAT